jgi:hypothetical protein
VLRRAGVCRRGDQLFPREHGKHELRTRRRQRLWWVRLCSRTSLLHRREWLRRLLHPNGAGVQPKPGPVPHLRRARTDLLRGQRVRERWLLRQRHVHGRRRHGLRTWQRVPSGRMPEWSVRPAGRGAVHASRLHGPPDHRRRWNLHRMRRRQRAMLRGSRWRRHSAGLVWIAFHLQLGRVRGVRSVRPAVLLRARMHGRDLVQRRDVPVARQRTSHGANTGSTSWAPAATN